MTIPLLSRLARSAAVATGILTSALASLTGAGPATAGPVVLPHSQELQLTSKAGLPYRIFIALPTEPPPRGGYPVLYVLDGNAVAGTLSDLSRTQGGAMGGLLEPAILVAIGYPGDLAINMRRRARDLTPVPTTAGSGTYLKAEDTGAADAFLAFIEDELKPALTASFPIDTARQGLMGHSFGGLFTLHVLFTRPQAFSTYIAASPSIWWADGAILKEAAAFCAHPPQNHPRLLLTVGAYEQELHPALRAAPDAPARARRMAARRMVDAARELEARIAAIPGRPVEVQLEVLPGQTHGSAAPYALLRGLQFFLGPESREKPL
ncbi:alpha/beta hydrolase [Xanthobacter sp. ZOL 2024]